MILNRRDCSSYYTFHSCGVTQYSRMDLTSPAQAKMFSRQTFRVRLTSASPLGRWSGLLVKSFRLNHDLHSEILELVHFTVAFIIFITAKCQE